MLSGLNAGSEIEIGHLFVFGLRLDFFYRCRIQIVQVPARMAEGEIRFPGRIVFLRLLLRPLGGLYAGHRLSTQAFSFLVAGRLFSDRPGHGLAVGHSMDMDVPVDEKSREIA